MPRHHIFAAFSGFLFLFAATAAKAQIDDDARTEFISPFKAKLADSKKFHATPSLPPLDTQDARRLDYVVPTRLKELSYPIAKIQPLDVSDGNNTKDSKAKTFYAKAGFGYPISPLVELSYHTPANAQYRFGATFRHHSGRGNFNDNQRFADNALNLQGAYFLQNGMAIGGDAGFNLDMRRFYGYPDTLADPPKDSVQQRFLDIHGGIDFFNAKPTKADFNYRARLGIRHMSDRFGTTELALSPELRVEKWFGAKNRRHPLVVDLGLHYTNLQDTFGSDSLISRAPASRALLHVHPHFSYNGGVFRARIGTNLGLNAGDFYIYPDLEALVSLLNGKINVFGGWSGGVQRNDLRTLSQYSPFIVSYLDARHTNRQDFYAGIKGSVKKYHYDLRVSYALAQNLPLFLNDSLSNYRRMRVVYDTAQIFAFNANLAFEITQGLRFSSQIGFFLYNTEQYAKAYHLPNFESKFNLHYNYKKFEASASFYVNSGLPYFDEISRTDKTLNGLFDLNLGASYYFTPNIGAFLALNNILNNQNQRWHYYPQIGFNAMAGIVAKF